MTSSIIRRRLCVLRVPLLGVAIAATAVHAQDRGEQRDTARVVTLDSIEVSVLRRPVTAARAPAAVSVLGLSNLQRGQLTVGLDESLVAVPGVLVNNRYNPSLGTRVSIRGFGARAAFGVRGVRLIADGIPLTMPDGQSNLNNLDLGAAGRVEVMRGPASALHGNAAGGVIAIQSETPPPGLSMQARMILSDLDGDRTGIANLRKLQVKIGGASGRSDYLASVARQEADGYRDFSASRQTLLNFRGNYALDDASRLSIVLSAVDLPRAESPGALPRDSALRDPRMAWPNNVRTGSGEVTRQGQIGAAYSRWSGMSRLDLSLHGVARSLENALPFGFIELDRRAGGTRVAVSATGELLGRGLEVNAGADLELQSDERKEFNNVDGRPGGTLRRNQTDQVSSIGPFVQVALAVAPRVALSLAARYDAVRFRTDDRFLDDGRDDSGERTLTAVSPIVGVMLAVSPETNLYGNVATSFQTPTTTELINAPPPVGQPCCPAGFNVDLEPQRAVSYEVGVKGLIAQRVSYDVALYHMDVRNALVPFQVPQVEAREFFRNAGESRHRGVELGLGGSLRGVGLSGAYTYSDFIFIDEGLEGVSYEGNRLPGIPPHRLYLGTRFSATRGLAIEADLEHTSEFFVTDANDAVNPAATVIDLRLLFDTGVGPLGARPFLAINNVTNERYFSSVVVNAGAARYYEPAPGRHLIVGLTIGTGGWAR